MTLNRAAVIKRYLDAIDPSHQEFWTIPFRGKSEELRQIRVDTKDVRYNANLGRLILNRFGNKQGLESPDDPKTQEAIEKLILEHPEAKELRRHIQDEGQLQPGILTFDGTLVNGNRRLAVLRSLFKETKDDHYRYMKVAVLPSDATPPEMYLLEVNLQMTPETRARYGPITTLVQLRWGIEYHKLDKARVAHAMYLDQEDVEERLEILQIIDEYLVFTKRPGQYAILEGGMAEADHQGKYQHFVELHKLKQKHGKQPYWEAFQRRVFDLIWGGKTYDEIRDLKRWTVDDVVLFANELSGAQGASTTKSPTRKPARQSDIDALAADLSEIGASVNVAAATAAANIPMPKGPRDPRTDDEPEKDPEFKKTADAVRTVNEAVQARKAKKRPAELLSQALRKLEALALIVPGMRASDVSDKKELDELLDGIVKRAASLRKQFASISKGK